MPGSKSKSKCDCKRCTSCDKYLKITYPRGLENFTRSRATFKSDGTPINDADGWWAMSVNSQATDQFGKKYSLLFNSNVVQVPNGDTVNDISLTTVVISWEGCNGKYYSRSTIFYGIRRDKDTFVQFGEYIDLNTDSRFIIDNDKFGTYIIPKNPC